MTLESVGWGISVAAVAGAFAYWIVKTLVKSGVESAIAHGFNRKLEAEKVSLKKSEVYFERQLEALSQLQTFSRKIVPRRRDPHMVWSEACEEIAEDFAKHEGRLIDFLCRYEAVLPPEVAADVEAAISVASDGQFQFVWNGPQLAAPEPTYDAIQSADKLCDLVKDAIRKLQAHVDAQAGVK